jgi:hypothetical protein
VDLLPLFIGAGSLSVSFLGSANTGNQIISHYLMQRDVPEALRSQTHSIYSFLGSFWYIFPLNSDDLATNDGDVCVCVCVCVCEMLDLGHVRQGLYH